jgi:hypothetical protein
MDKRILDIAILGAALALGACQTPPPTVYPTLEASPDLFRVNPVDIAVLPVQDATPDGSAAGVIDDIREQIRRSLVDRYYTPLASAKVDEVMKHHAPLGPGVSVIDAGWLRSLGGAFGEDASFAVRLHEWDDSTLMSTGWIRFAADVALASSQSETALWSGSFRGEVKAGGQGPTPRDRAQREASAAEQFARELVDRLPRRRPG